MGVRGTFVYRDGELVEKHLAERLFPRGPRNRDLPAPYVNIDTIVGLQSMVDGSMFDSKSQLREHYKAHGVREIGTDTAGALRDAEEHRPAKRGVTTDEIAQAVEKVKQGYKPEPLATMAELDAAEPDTGE